MGAPAIVVAVQALLFERRLLSSGDALHWPTATRNQQRINTQMQFNGAPILHRAARKGINMAVRKAIRVTIEIVSYPDERETPILDVEYNGHIVMTYYDDVELRWLREEADEIAGCIDRIMGSS